MQQTPNCEDKFLRYAGLYLIITIMAFGRFGGKESFACNTLYNSIAHNLLHLFYENNNPVVHLSIIMHFCKKIMSQNITTN